MTTTPWLYETETVTTHEIPVVWSVITYPDPTEPVPDEPDPEDVEWEEVKDGIELEDEIPIRWWRFFW